MLELKTVFISSNQNILHTYRHICAAWLSLERVITQLIDNYTHGLLKYDHSSLWIFMDVSQALLTLETKQFQTGFLLLVKVYLFFLWENIVWYAFMINNTLQRPEP